MYYKLNKKKLIILKIISNKKTSQNKKFKQIWHHHM